MKVGTDGVLLGAWAHGINPKRILDIGTGSGLIALMLAQRFPHAQVHAIEIEANAANEARKNFENSPFKAGLNLIEADVIGWKSEKSFDLIVSNPPYFENSLKNISVERSMARHADSLRPVVIPQLAKRFLAHGGSVQMIFPVDQVDLVVESAASFELYPHQILWVRNQEGYPLKRVLIDFREERSYTQEAELILYDSARNRSEAYSVLTREFYL